LYICYLALDDPLVETQVVAYLEGLAARGHVVHLLTFEHGRLSRRRRFELRRRLGARGIHWHGLRYHKRPSLIATGFDVLCGAIVAGSIVRRADLRAIHARSHVPVAMAVAVKRLARIPFIFDIRGLMAEEYVDAGRWAPNGIAFRITKAVERAAVRQAAANVVLTNRVKEMLFADRDGVYVIPCCADLERIAAQAANREQMRQRLRLGDRVVLIYVGKFTGWYMERQMVEFFAEARKSEPRLHFHILTQHDKSAIIDEFAKAGVREDAYSLTRVAPERVGEHLSAADAAISLIRRCPSKVSSSPTKIGEYLAAGLPVLASSGIGDLDELLGADGIGVLIDSFDPPTYARAAAQRWEVAAAPGAAARRIQLADQRLSLQRVGIPAYDALYRAVATEVAKSAV
jgi:glycosyltransferase involved in cell wall biosynthesis